MNKKIISIMVLICALTLSGCGFTESSELMTGARKFIENGEYDKAMTNLSKVLDEDESNSEARGMYYQAMKLKKAQKCESRKDYEQEIKELQDLLNDNSGSAKVRSQAEDMLAKAQEALKNQKRATITRKENAKKTAEENKNNYTSASIYSSNFYSDKQQYSSKSNSEDDYSDKTTEKKDYTGSTGSQDKDYTGSTGSNNNYGGSNTTGTNPPNTGNSTGSNVGGNTGNNTGQQSGGNTGGIGQTQTQPQTQQGVGN